MANERRDERPTGAAVVREAQGLGDRAIGTAMELAEQQKAAGAERVEHVAEALRSSAEELGASEQQLAEWVGTAAGQLEGLARTLREKDLSALMAEMEDFGRRQPAVFMGAAVALGFGIARFAKAGSRATGPAQGAQPLGQAPRAQASDREPGWTNDQPGRAARTSTGLGDLPGSAYRGPDRGVGGLHEDTGPFQRPQAGS
jgi:hypothetical protein